MPTKAVSFSQRQPRRRTVDRRASTAERGYGGQWQKLRLWHLRHNPLCVFCDSAASIVDHIKPITAGGEPLNPYNLRSVCPNCHARLTANYRRTGVNEMAGIVRCGVGG
jgi:5-methylcytosine-specific restriction endonuclease McrA